jgi:hypothetical protein
MNLSPAYKHKASYLVSHLPAPKTSSPGRQFSRLIWVIFIPSWCYVFIL